MPDCLIKLANFFKSGGIRDIRKVKPKLALPIFEQSALEDEPDLQKLWCNLLANAMNPTFNLPLRSGFVDMIKGITGIEAKLLNDFYSEHERLGKIKPISRLSEHGLDKEWFISLLQLTEDEYAIAANNLMRLQLIAPAVVPSPLVVGMDTMSGYKGIKSVTLTPLGVLFVEACMK